MVSRKKDIIQLLRAEKKRDGLTPFVTLLLYTQQVKWEHNVLALYSVKKEIIFCEDGTTI